MSNRGMREEINAAGQWLRAQREQRHIKSQAELARRLGWDKTMVNNYETRGVTVPDDRAEQLAEFFGMDIIEVRRGLGLWVPPSGNQPAEGEQDDADALSPEEIATIERIRSNPKKRARLVEAILAASGRLAESTDTGEYESPGHRKSG